MYPASVRMYPAFSSISGLESSDTIFSFGYSNMAATKNIITVPQNELRQFLKGVEVFDRAEMVRKGKEMDKTTVCT